VGNALVRDKASKKCGRGSQKGCRQRENGQHRPAVGSCKHTKKESKDIIREEGLQGERCSTEGGGAAQTKGSVTDLLRNQSHVTY